MNGNKNLFRPRRHAETKDGRNMDRIDRIFRIKAANPMPRQNPGNLVNHVYFSSSAFVSSCLCGLLIALFLLTSGARADTPLPPQLRDVGFDQRLDEQAPLDLQFADESGKPVVIRDYFHEKPVILVMAYYRCPMLCTLVLNGLVQGLRDISLDVGKDFEVVTVSFDPRETPDLATAKKQTYLSRYDRPGAEGGWHFLTGQEPAIRELAQSVGFRYHYDPATDQFAHAAGIIVLTPTGKISRYFYDIRFSPRDLRLGLVEASSGKIGSPIDQALLFCFHYDPSVGRYGVAVMNFIRLGGVLTMLALGAFIGIQFRRERKRDASSLPPVPIIPLSSSPSP